MDANEVEDKDPDVAVDSDKVAIGKRTRTSRKTFDAASFGKVQIL